MKRYKKTSALLMASILGATLAMTGCETAINDQTKVNSNEEKSNEESKVSGEDISQACTNMGYQILSERLANNDGTTNVMVSPVSVAFALDMVAMGAEGNTYDNMSDILGGGASKTDIENYVDDYLASLNEDDALRLSDSIWVNQDISLNPDYKEILEKSFKATASEEDFSDAATLNKINEWVEDGTDGMIDKILNDINPEEQVILVNATCFDSKWKDEYEEYQIDLDGIFTNGMGEQETAKMMRCTVEKYLSTDKAVGFLKPYEGGRYVFMAILPSDENVSMAEFSQDFNEKDFMELYDSKTKMKVYTTMPAFTFDYEADLSDTLVDIGMDIPFGQEADLSGMFALDEGNMVIGRVIHKTHIELDEKGTKAAAATAVTVKTTSLEEEEESATVTLDRPFMFAIIDTEYDVPVFIGAVNTVE